MNDIVHRRAMVGIRATFYEHHEYREREEISAPWFGVEAKIRDKKINRRFWQRA